MSSTSSSLSSLSSSSLGLVLEGGGGGGGGGGLRYALPTPDVSPLDSAGGGGGGPGRSLDYLGHHYAAASLAQERFAFDSGPLPGFMSSCSGMDYTGQSWTKMEQYDHAASSYQLLPSSLEQASHYHAQHREVLDVGDSLSSALAGLRESYYDYNMPKVSEM